MNKEGILSEKGNPFGLPVFVLPYIRSGHIQWIRLAKSTINGIAIRVLSMKTAKSFQKPIGTPLLMTTVPTSVR